MKAPSLKEFVGTILRSKLVERERLQQLIEQFSKTAADRSAKNFARFLVTDGTLSTYQIKRLLAGRSEGFFLGGCRILDRLGEGGMGVVYLAQQDRLDRQVAIKVMSGSANSSPEALERFYREARAAAKLKHPNIVQVFDVGQEKSTHFIVMELVNGRNLSDHLKDFGTFGIGKSAALIRQTAEGLAHAHSNGVIHRDIKPSNLVLEGNVLKILDLGLARHESDDRVTADHTVMGTVDYMSPEQCQGSKDVDHQSDIYSLGCTWFHLLAGEAPFADRPTTGKLLSHMTDPVPCVCDRNHQIPEQVDQIIQRMTAKNKADRYPDADTLVEDLRALEDSLSGETVAFAIQPTPHASARPEADDSATAGQQEYPAQSASGDNANTIVNRPASTLAAAFYVVPVMAALVLGGVYIGIRILADRVPSNASVASSEESTTASDNNDSQLNASEQSSDVAFTPDPADSTNDPISDASDSPPDAVTTGEASDNPSANTVTDATDPVVPDRERQPDNSEMTGTTESAGIEDTPQKTDSDTVVAAPTRTPRELVVREFTEDWNTSLVDGDVLTLIASDPYLLSEPVEQSHEITIQGTEERRALVYVDYSQDTPFWTVRESQLTLRRIDLYVQTPPGTDHAIVFHLIDSDITVSDCSVTIIESAQRTCRNTSLIQLQGERPWDVTAGGQPPETLKVFLEQAFVRGSATVIENASTHSASTISNCIITGSGPALSANNTEERTTAHQRMDLTVTSSTLDIEQPVFVLECRPYELRPVPAAIGVERSVVLTTGPVAARAPLVSWDSPVETRRVADAVRYAGAGNLYCDRNEMFRVLLPDGQISTLCQLPFDWERQELGQDLDSVIIARRGSRFSPTDERSPRDFEITSLIRGQTETDGVGADVRQHRLPRPLRGVGR